MRAAETDVSLGFLDDDEDLGEALDDNDNNNEADLEEVAHDRDRPTKRRAYAFDELQGTTFRFFLFFSLLHS